MSDDQPLVSIVVPTYNNGHLIYRAIDSIISQTFKNWEIIIIDNYSTDNTISLVEEYRGICNIKFFQIHNGGVIAKSRNLGIQNSSGDYIAFLDSDDWWLPTKLEKSINYLKSGSDIVYHDLRLFGKNGEFVFFNKAKTRNLKKPVSHDLIFNGNGINNSSVVVRKSILERVGFLSEEADLFAWEDFDYWIRISKITENFGRIPECLGFYWVGGGNVSNPKRTIKILEMIKSKFSSEYGSFYGKFNKYPSWIEYNMLVAKIELEELTFLDLVKSFKLITFDFKLKIGIKFLLDLITGKS
ncbi:glycosyltransferase-like protein, family 2 [Leptospira wolbachii serovar Codice str. CDC]|uniref:Glycosyltransferase-like protein, family 2 n=1 Tax=Leptospira wolbachii serovar Codice str. CDC TaxID=1218599 RepID=R9AD15_9LEPT|nr:glycosyltransferase [Leptospira wolbachii]EOQ98045.1 glycosyltransferase-like protein, family 2 [Leptospira wolbachii serovar Codice str. CDC]